jgi:hypothetical protein
MGKGKNLGKIIYYSYEEIPTQVVGKRRPSTFLTYNPQDPQFKLPSVIPPLPPKALWIDPCECRASGYRR